MAELSLSELQAFDAHTTRTGREQRFCCPLPACTGKPINAAHRSLTVNMDTGAWNCKRCGDKGKLQEFHTERAPVVTSKRARAARELERWTGLDVPGAADRKQRGGERLAGLDTSRAVIANRLTNNTGRAEVSSESKATCSAQTGEPLADVNAAAAPVSSSAQQGRNVQAEASTGPALDTNNASRAVNGTQWREAIRGLVKMENTPGAAYVQGRGLSLELAQASGARFASNFYGRPALLFPIRDATGKSVAAQGRYIDTGREPKARTVGSLADGAFWTPDALESGRREPVVICEAPFDALSLAACGLPALALCGTSLRPWMLRRCLLRPVLLAFDADDAGDRAAQEWGAALAPYTARVHRLRPVGGKDWNEILTTHGLDSLAKSLAASLDKIGYALAPSVACSSAAMVNHPCQSAERLPGAAEQESILLALDAAPNLQAEASRPMKASSAPPTVHHEISSLPKALVPFANLIQAAQTGLLPRDPVRLDAGLMVLDVAAKVLLHVEDVKRAEAGDTLLQSVMPVVLRDMKALLRWYNGQAGPL